MRRRILLVGLLAAAPAALPAPQVLYETGFEQPTFETAWVLDGRDGWLATPPAALIASQIVDGAFPGYGQQAVIGYTNQINSTEFSYAYRPLNFTPLASGRPWVAFSVKMAIIDSTTTNRDSFRWSVYNRTNSGERLFSVEFDNQTGRIWYLLDDDEFRRTEWSFERSSVTNIYPYNLTVTMNFASNNWSATLNSEILVQAAQLTTRGRTLDLGDISAVWVLGVDNRQLGDNYMVFDDYRVVADTARPLPCQVHLVRFLEHGDLLLQLVGEPGRSYAMEASPDLLLWTPFATNTPTDGTFLVLDPGALGRSQQFYRGRAVWP